MLRTLLFLFLILLLAQILSAEQVWEPANAGIVDTDMRSISVFNRDDRLVCAASQKIAYLSRDQADSWRQIFSLAAEEGEINFVQFSYLDPQLIYVATSEGLYRSQNQGQDWQRIFTRVNQEAKDVNWITISWLDARKMYIGTRAGLYYSYDSGETWSRISAGLPRAEVSSLVIHPANARIIYLANSYGLFKTIDGAQSWTIIYVTSYKVSDEQQEQEESEQITEQQNIINCLTIDQDNPKKIFIATAEGVYFSSDAGGSWNKLPTQGLSNEYINFVVSDQQHLYAASQNGVFIFSFPDQSWQKIFSGLTARQVRSLALGEDGEQLFAASDRGIFKTAEIKLVKQNRATELEIVSEVGQQKPLDCELILQQFAGQEPSVLQVQEAALTYAEVIHPQKIKNLRRDARLKALLPDVSVDYDKTVYGSSTTKVGFVGPRDWSLSLSWDVGDLVFNEQLRLIDSNARLYVQLRDDIINEVTRYYYERRKLQTELIMAPPKTPQEKLTKTLRLKELTANIDGLTGGYLSRQIANPEGKY